MRFLVEPHGKLRFYFVESMKLRKSVYKNLFARFLIVVVTCAAIPLSQAEDQNQLNKECFRQNKGRSCVRLGTTLWQSEEKRADARRAFAKGCELKIESACTLKEMGVSTADTADKNLAGGSAQNAGGTDKTEISGIEKTGPTSYKVARGTLTKYAGDLDNTLSTAEMVSQKTKGAAVGFRFKSIDKESVFEKLGFRVGDVVTQVNDQKVTTREDALAILPGLLYGSTESYRVRLIRDGQAVTQDFQIVQ